MEIRISEDKVGYLSPQAKDEFIDSLKAYASDLIDEANRLEAATSTSKDQPEITRTIIKDATLYLKKYTPKNKPQSWGFTILQILSALFTLFTGGLFEVEKFKTDTTHLTFFLIVLTITIVSNTAVIILGRNK